MTSLIQYDRARAALAEATKIDDILPLLDEFEIAKVRARQIKDQALLADATEFQLRAERRLGQVLEAAKAAGLFKQGRQPKAGKSSPDELSSRPTLEEAGIDKHLSSRAQKRSGIAEQAFEAMVARTRERIASGAAKIVPASEINGARAIMGSRVEDADSLDYSPTPPYGTRALIEQVFPHLYVKPKGIVWEPACGEGHMAEVLAEYFPEVVASDIHDYGYGRDGVDFLSDGAELDGGCDWIVTNPPFKEKAEKFALLALDRARVGVAIFARLQWLETIGRYERLFKEQPPTLIAFFCERINLCMGRWDPDGGTATAYIWLVWVKGERPRAPFWIPPGCRKELSKPDDVARFTIHPVTKKIHCDESYNPETGEILSPPSVTVSSAGDGEEPAAAVRAPSAVAGSDDLNIPKFLQRQPGAAAHG